MKFGSTLYQRSVPKWAAYNVQYNELKHLIKQRTTAGSSTAVPIPGQSDHRWSILEDELYGVLKEQYDSITLFLRSKHGEIERRLAYLDKSVRSAKRSANLYSGRPSLQARKYQRLIQEADNIGEDIQALTRFAAVQKTAFRKILKKYQKWTNSGVLRARLETEVFSDGQLELNLTDQMHHLSAQMASIKELESTLLRPDPLQQNGRIPSRLQVESPVSQITKASLLGPLRFDAALASIPFGEAAGTATYWIHVDNLDEAQVLLLRYTRDVALQPALSRENSSDSATPTISKSEREISTHACFLDNAYRFVQDSSTHSPSRIAMCARWSPQSKEATITLSDMTPKSDTASTIGVKRKDLASAVDRDLVAPTERDANAANVRTVRDFLSQHRDVKALAEVRSQRFRYVGLTNSSEVGTFASLDTNISFTQFNNEHITNVDSDSTYGLKFPHAVLQIRWEFGRKPEVVRALDTTHLAERVADFTLEGAAIHSQYPQLTKPSWTIMLQKDIRKVPVQARHSRRTDISSSGLNSAPSSTDGPIDSVFSTPFAQSTAGSETSPVASMHREPTSHSEVKAKSKKKARIVAESPKRQRYYSEYDDPDSEFNQETYTIYVDPNEEAPGMATLRKIGNAFSAPYTWFTSSSSKTRSKRGERAALLGGNTNRSQDEDEGTSESDSDLVTSGIPRYKGLQGRIRPAERYRRRLSRRQQRYERMLVQFYSGLIVLSYMFLLMSATLLATGRRRKVVEVDVGATVGVIFAFACMLMSWGLVFMKKQKLKSVEVVSLILADGMIVLFGAAVIIGIVQRATYVKKKT